MKLTSTSTFLRITIISIISGLTLMGYIVRKTRTCCEFELSGSKDTKLNIHHEKLVMTALENTRNAVRQANKVN